VIALFDSLWMGGVTIGNRLVMAPLTRGRTGATERTGWCDAPGIFPAAQVRETRDEEPKPMPSVEPPSPARISSNGSERRFRSP